MCSESTGLIQTKWSDRRQRQAHSTGHGQGQGLIKLVKSWASFRCIAYADSKRWSRQRCQLPMVLSYLPKQTTKTKRGPDDDPVWFAGRPVAQEHVLDFCWVFYRLQPYLEGVEQTPERNEKMLLERLPEEKRGLWKAAQHKQPPILSCSRRCSAHTQIKCSENFCVHVYVAMCKITIAPWWDYFYMKKILPNSLE